MMVKKIYLLEMETDSGERFHKIGISKNVERRVKTLQTGNCFDIKTVYVFDTEIGELTESTLHRLYAPLHKRGEWFELDDEQVESFPQKFEQTEKNLVIMINENTYWKKYNT